MTDSELAEQRTRQETGVSGIDVITGGGLLSGSVYIIRGTPGAGKTTLANQICFHRAAQGQHCLYITLLSESHDRLIENLQHLNFFVPDSVERIHYQSGFHTLEEEGLKGVLRMMMEETKRWETELVVLDGLIALHEKVGSEREFRLFLNQLQNVAHLTGSTMLLLTNSSRDAGSPEYTMVDGWLELDLQQHDYRVARYLQIHKLRGSGFIEGRHALTLSSAGITIMPRLESVERQRVPAVLIGNRLSTGLEGLDVMVGGGVRGGSNTLIAGATGVGKTALGLHFISRSSREEPGLIFGFYESEQDLIEKADMLGICDLRALLDSGDLEIIWSAPTEHLLDNLAYRLIAAVRRRGVKRLFVDGVNAFLQSTLHPERISRFLAALTNVLHDEGVTAMFTLETPELVGGEMRISFTSVSSIAQNVLLLRYTELHSQTHRTLSIIKARTSPFDPRIRTFTITNNGIDLAGPLNAEDVLTGHAHPHSPKGTDPNE